jgi:outer membrane protein OmpA-like peptidoglycan-associated protein
VSSEETQTSAPTSKRRRFGLRASVAAIVIALVVGVLAWATFWPMDPCSHPSCVRKRFELALEVDAFETVEPIAFSFDTEEGPVSLQSILATGGIDLTVTYDDLHVPYKAASGPLDRADLYQFVSAWRNRPAHPQADASLYALFTAGLISDKGEPLFGIMFDLTDREAFAIAPSTTLRFFEKHESEHIQTLQLRTFVHELLHALNRDHVDAASMSDGRLTLEAPTRCLAVGRPREWRLVEPPLMALSPTTIQFFQSASSREVLPGKQNSPYRQRRTSPSECEYARSNFVVAREETGWRLTLRHLKELFAINVAAAAEQQGEQQQGEQTEEQALQDFVETMLNVRLQAQPAAYPLGYPIAVRVQVTNETDMPLPLRGRLNPGYGLLQFDYRRANEEEWQTLQPLTWFEPTSDASAMLNPGETTEETIPIYFGEDGWTFKEPGEYEMRARVELRESLQDATSDIVAVRVSEPYADDDRAALQPLLNPDGELDRSLGRLLSFGGRIGNAADITPLESVAAIYGHTALGGALRLTLLSQRLRPPIDPRTGERPAPDFSDARSLIEDTCTDSGVAALTAELLDQRADTIPSRFGEDVVSPAAAWDGKTARGAVLPTYSDPALYRWGPSVHFCFNEAALRSDVSRELRPLGRQLARERPPRIVLIGHADHAGTCRLNDAIALRRAEAVRDALVASGVNRRAIQIVSLGERRPVDFSATEQAHALNRRVEILVEGTRETDEDAQPLMPMCPPR